MGAPKSYTGEDVVEIYCHGGIAVLQRVLEQSLSAGARLAERGEFTKRAFLNRKIDLPQAEAVLDMVSANTAQCAGFAVRQLEGRLSGIVSGIRERCLFMLAELEAAIDFPEDVSDVDRESLTAGLKGQINEIEGLLATAEGGRIFRSGLATVIIGKPNVGKSSLLNALLGEERAIVTEVPGTTRDAIEESIDIKGIPLKIVDTAGIRHPKDRVEEFGVARTERELESAEFSLIVVDGSNELDEMDTMVLNKARGKKGVVVINKIDLGCVLTEDNMRGIIRDYNVYKTSARFGDGIGGLIDGIYDYLQCQKGLPGTDSIAINSRHKQCLVRARDGLVEALESCSRDLPGDFVTIDLKQSILALGEVTGEVVSEEVIKSIFDQFCVGK
jgi:tRNA modification GTPase